MMVQVQRWRPAAVVAVTVVAVVWVAVVYLWLGQAPATLATTPAGAALSDPPKMKTSLQQRMHADHQMAKDTREWTEERGILAWRPEDCSMQGIRRVSYEEWVARRLWHTRRRPFIVYGFWDSR